MTKQKIPDKIVRENYKERESAMPNKPDYRIPFVHVCAAERDRENLRQCDCKYYKHTPEAHKFESALALMCEHMNLETVNGCHFWGCTCKGEDNG